MIKIRLDEQLSLRFKKLDDKLRSRNVRTNTQAQLYFQMEFDGFAPLTNVTFGYKTDVLGRDLLGAFFTCPTGWSKNSWVIEVGEGANALPLFDLPVTPTLPGTGAVAAAPAADDVKVVAKRTKKRAE